jgi:hypothetical protein
VKIWGGIFTFTGFLLFAPQSTLESLGLLFIRTQYRGWIAGLFFLALAMLLANLLPGIFKFAKSELRKNRRMQQGYKRLQNLTWEEKTILQLYILQGKRATNLSVTDGAVTELMREGIIIFPLSAQLFEEGEWETACSIAPWAWDYLNKYPELLKMSESEN